MSYCGMAQDGADLDTRIEEVSLLALSGRSRLNSALTSVYAGVPADAAVQGAAVSSPVVAEGGSSQAAPPGMVPGAFRPAAATDGTEQMCQLSNAAAGGQSANGRDARQAHALGLQSHPSPTKVCTSQRGSFTPPCDVLRGKASLGSAIRFTDAPCGHISSAHAHTGAKWSCGLYQKGGGTFGAGSACTRAQRAAWLSAGPARTGRSSAALSSHLQR